MGGSVWVGTHRCVSVLRPEVALKVYTLTHSHFHPLLLKKNKKNIDCTRCFMWHMQVFTMQLQTCYVFFFTPYRVCLSSLCKTCPLFTFSTIYCLKYFFELVTILYKCSKWSYVRIQISTVLSKFALDHKSVMHNFKWYVTRLFRLVFAAFPLFFYVKYHQTDIFDCCAHVIDIKSRTLMNKCISVHLNLKIHNFLSFCQLLPYRIRCKIFSLSSTNRHYPSQ